MQKLTFRKPSDPGEIPDDEEWFLVLDKDGDISVARWNKRQKVFWSTCYCNTGTDYVCVEGIIGASEINIIKPEDVTCENCKNQPCEIFRNACEEKRKELGVTDEDWNTLYDSEERYDLLREICVETSKNCMYKIGVD